jgi:nicotinate-nucleotide adenylyltransferase
LQARYPQVRFVWIMGADNLAQFHRWKQWRDIAGRVDILVVDRKPWTHRALHSKAAQALRRTRSTPHQALAGGASRPPQWWYHFGRISPLSASDLRKTLGKKAFLLHTKN